METQSTSSPMWQCSQGTCGGVNTLYHIDDCRQTMNCRVEESEIGSLSKRQISQFNPPLVEEFNYFKTNDANDYQNFTPRKKLISEMEQSGDAANCLLSLSFPLHPEQQKSGASSASGSSGISSSSFSGRSQNQSLVTADTQGIDLNLSLSMNGSESEPGYSTVNSYIR